MGKSLDLATETWGDFSSGFSGEVFLAFKIGHKVGMFPLFWLRTLSYAWATQNWGHHVESWGKPAKRRGQLAEDSRVDLGPWWRHPTELTNPEMALPLDFFFFFFNIYLFGCTGSQLWHAGSSLWCAGSFSCGMQTLNCDMWDIVPWPGIEPGPAVLGKWSPSHWTTREVPGLLIKWDKDSSLWVTLICISRYLQPKTL